MIIGLRSVNLLHMIQDILDHSIY